LSREHANIGKFSLYRGMLVSLPKGRGVGKLEAVHDSMCSVLVFCSIIRSEIVHIPSASLRRAYLSPQTRVYVRDEERHRVGRVTDFYRNDNGLVDYEVRFPNGKRADFSELSLFIRPWSAPDDPAEVLARGGAESQYLYDRRQAAVLPLVTLRGAAQGMTALISSGIELAAHQVAAVRRVLTDPVQRYLLADEVGLGKTIEAGLIVRQHLIDNPETRVILAVPAHLCPQWRHELSTKFLLDQFGDTVEVIAHADLVRVQCVPDILVVDEAHHLVGIEEGELAPSSKRLRAVASEVPVLLLLSATPALGNEARFLALLNLLDPNSHPLEDVDGFRRKLEGRREIGRLLLGLDPEAPRLVLRQRCAEMERLFPDDLTIRELAPQLVAATRDAPAEVPALCVALKSYIADSYRIHQRLIRSRRAEAEPWAFSPRGSWADGKPTFTHVRVEADDSAWVATLLSVLEEWRFAAVEAAVGDERILNQTALRYADLLNATTQGRRVLNDWISACSTRPSFAEEPLILDSLRLLAEEGEDEKESDYSTACESTRRLLRILQTDGKGSKIVAFSSTTASAFAFHAALIDTLGDCRVMLLTGDGATEDEATIAAFTSPSVSAVLICDRHGEEGLNLTCANAIIHLDLPISAARIEQRIGRLDRFGRRIGAVRHRIMLPVDEDDSPWTGWIDFLSEGLGLFHQSISDIQFLLEGFELKLFRVLLERGPIGVQALSAEVRDAIGEERRSQDEQYALDRIALSEEPVETFIQTLEAAEEDESALQDGVEHWLIGALLLKKQPVAWPVQDPFKLHATKETLVPRLPWLDAFNLEQLPALTWRRRVASANPEAMLLRPGTPLLDLVERFTLWDDRGTAFVTWRTATSWAHDLWMGFRLCFVLEPDIPISDMFAPSRTELAALRRAQRYLPPRMLSVHVGIDGLVVQDPLLLSILTRPYCRGDAGAGGNFDLNLASRPHILDSVIDPATFANLCRSTRDRCRGALLAEKSLGETIAAAQRLAAVEVERRRIRLRQRYSSGDLAVQADIQAIESILPAISTPSLRLDSMGCFIVSAEPPGLDPHE
jgi:ATP-dependent helicase HepA